MNLYLQARDWHNFFVCLKLMSQSIAIMSQSIGCPKINRLTKKKSKEKIFSCFHSLRHNPNRPWHIFQLGQSIGYKYQSMGHYKKLPRTFRQFQIHLEQLQGIFRSILQGKLVIKLILVCVSMCYQPYNFTRKSLNFYNIHSYILERAFTHFNTCLIL